MSRALKGRNKVRRGPTSTDRRRSMGAGVSSSRGGRRCRRALFGPFQGTDGLGPRSQGGADRPRDVLGSGQHRRGRSALPWARMWLPRWGVTASSDNDASPWLPPVTIKAGTATRYVFNALTRLTSTTRAVVALSESSVVVPARDAFAGRQLASEWEDWLTPLRGLKWIVHSRSSWEVRKDVGGVPLRAKTRLAEGERGRGGECVPTGRRLEHAVRGEAPVSTGAADLMRRRLPLRTACLGRRLVGEPSRHQSCPFIANRVSAQ